MKFQQVISTGFAIAAIAAASVPAVGWMLLGDAILQRPAAGAPSSAETDPFLLADASFQRVVMRGSAAGRERANAANASIH